jgi:hypothetical protein
MPSRVRHIAGFLTILLCGPALARAAEASYEGLGRLVEAAKPKDGIEAGQLARIRAAVAAYEKRRGAGPAAGKDEAPFRYPFFPHAGILGQDIFLENFTDQDNLPRTFRDWDCSDYTYDGHQGHDSLIRSFREQAIGVPVFAARDGVVVDTHDGEPDMNTVWDERNQANYVLIDHGGGYIGWYFHLKNGSVAVATGQTVTAGTQIGLTGSSGFSNWPHLHFETRKDKAWIEPSAGPCRSGDSLWVDQPPVDRDFYLSDFYMARGEIDLPNEDSFLFDEAEREATFVKGKQTLSVRLDMRNLPTRAPYDLRVLDPRHQVVTEISSVFPNSGVYHLAYWVFPFFLDLDVTGTWKFQVEIDGNLVVDAPFRVVATAKQVTNRAPNRITARLSQPAEAQFLTCQVQTPLVARDPDFDIVRYTYEWRVNNKVARTVTSAGLADVLAAGLTKPGDKVKCKVVPSDGKRSGPAATAQIVARP